MLRNVYLQGDLGDRFGQKFRMEASTTSEVLRCIYANRPEFRKYLVDCIDKGVDLSIKHQEKEVSEEDFLFNLKEGDITIAIVPSGSKKAIKIIAAVALFIYAPQIAVGLGQTTAVTVGTGAMAFSYNVASAAAISVIQSVAINLGLQGLAELMAPDPSVDDPTLETANYLFNGTENTSGKFDPVPILYGELRVPGRLIDFNITNGIFVNPTTIQEPDGHLSTVRDDKYTRGQ